MVHAHRRALLGEICRAKWIISLLTMVFLCSTSHAVEGAFSNYIPGFYGDLALAVEPPKGLSIRNDVYYYSGDANGSVRSAQFELDAEVTFVYDYLTFLYNPDIQFLGAQLAFGATLAVGYVDIDALVQDGGGQSLIAKDDTVGIGDPTFSANFYWSEEKWNFLWANFVVAPVGSYDVDDLANVSLNYWTLETDGMVTYFDQEKGRDYSIVVGYSYNKENNDTNYKSGDEFHVDVVLNQFFTDSFGIGINGFFYRQLSGDSGSGALLGDFKGEAAGIGPVVYWITKVFDRDVYLTAKWLSEFNVKNRFEGDHVFASFAFSL
jgi:hypothetical protein